MAEATAQAPSRPERKTPVGTIHIVDPHPLNWLYITWNTMEEPVRTDAQGHLVGAAVEQSRWVGDETLEVRMRRDVRFQDGEECTAHSFKRAFEEVQRWKAPHPPGTSLNFHPDTRLEIIDDYTLRMHFPEPDGLILGKFRGFHIASTRFWDEIGFGYKKLGTAEGHW